MPITLIPWLTGGPRLVSEDDVTLLTFDNTFKESHDYKMEVTSHPIEAGAPITDHVVEQQTRVSMTLHLTDHPIDDNDPVPLRAKKQFETLLQIFREKTPLQLVTGLAVYNDMVIESISVPRDEPIYGINPQVDFVQITRAQRRTVFLPADVVAKAQPKTKVGQQGTEEATEEQGSKNQTLLKAGFGEGFGIGFDILESLGI